VIQFDFHDAGPPSEGEYPIVFADIGVLSSSQLKGWIVRQIRIVEVHRLIGGSRQFGEIALLDRSVPFSGALQRAKNARLGAA